MLLLVFLAGSFALLVGVSVGFDKEKREFSDRATTCGIVLIAWVFAWVFFALAMNGFKFGGRLH